MYLKNIFLLLSNKEIETSITFLLFLEYFFIRSGLKNWALTVKQNQILPDF